MAHYDPALPKEKTVAAGVLPSALRVAREHGVGVMINRPLHAIPPLGFNSGDWARSDNRQFLKLRDAAPVPPALAVLHSILSDVAGSMPALVPPKESNSTDTHSDAEQQQQQQQRESLQRLSLWAAASVPNVDVVLSGARREAYVDDLAAVSQWGRLGEEKVWSMFDQLQDAVEELSEAEAGF